MILHGIMSQLWNNFQLFFLVEISGNTVTDLEKNATFYIKRGEKGSEKRGCRFKTRPRFIICGCVFCRVLRKTVQKRREKARPRFIYDGKVFHRFFRFI